MSTAPAMSLVVPPASRAARVRARAPLRLSFCGGGTDVLPYVTEQGGCVLSATIDHYAYASLVPRKGACQVTSHDYGLTTMLDLDRPLVYDGQLDLVKATLAWFKEREREGRIAEGAPGFELHLHTDAPPGSGLGASSAVVVAMIEALVMWRYLSLSSYEKAQLAYELERVELGIPGGMQDQYSAVFGGFNFIEFAQDGEVVVNSLRVRRDVVNELEHSMLLCYTGGTRLSANIIGEQLAGYAQGSDRVVHAMSQLKELTVAMKDALLRGRLSEFGNLLNEAWENKKQMASGITTPLIDDAYEVARNWGALGGKISGAGGGGFMYFFCPGETRHIVADRMKGMGFAVRRFAFAREGVQAWELP